MKCRNCQAALTSPTGVSLSICPFCKTNAAAKKARGDATTLQEVFSERGTALYKNSKMLASTLKDCYQHDKKLLRVLTPMVQDGIAEKIADLLHKSADEQRMQLAQLIRFFAEDYSIRPEAAARAACVLAAAAGIAEGVLEGLPISDAGSPRSDLPHENTPPIGSKYSLAGLEWQVLDVQDGKALLLCDAVLDEGTYHDFDGEAKVESITWEESLIRLVLNLEWLGDRDTWKHEDLARISQATMPNNDNPWYGTAGGNATQDRVFLLSIEEAAKYLGSNNLARPKMDALEKGGLSIEAADDEYEQFGYPEMSLLLEFPGNPKLMACDKDGDSAWWWLRSPGANGKRAAAVSHMGCIAMYGAPVGADMGVRPALWINL